MTAVLLRELVARPGLVVAPGVYDGISTALVERSQFPVAYMTGAGVSASAVGLPDIGLATMTEMAAQAAVIKRGLSKPLIADADTGFGDVTNLYRTVQEYERIGVAAIQLEDQIFPKRCGHLDNKAVVDAHEFVAKIHAAVDARTDMLIIARTDARAVSGLDEALRRAALYVKAGADIIFIEAPQTVDEIARIPNEVDAPVLFNLVPGGKTPQVSLEQLEAFGYALAIAPAAGIGGAVQGITDVLAALSQGDVSGTGLASPREFFTTLGLPVWENIRTTYGSGDVNA
jgi:2-methylisocitrate lyase-like PEP mutase family enzyme